MPFSTGVLRPNFQVIVPPGKRLEATTGDGLAEIKYKGDVVARTRGGDVVLETPAHASVASETGRIDAKLAAAAWERPQSLVSRGGDVTVWLRQDANAALRSISSGVREDKLLGAGGPPLELESGAGRVRIIPYTA